MRPRWRHHVDTNTILLLSIVGKTIFFYFQFPFHRFLLHLKKIPNFESIVRTRVLNSHPAIDTFQLCGVGKSVKCHWNPFQKVTSTQSQRVELGSVTQVPVIRREKNQRIIVENVRGTGFDDDFLSSSSPSSFFLLTSFVASTRCRGFYTFFSSSEPRGFQMEKVGNVW